MNHLETVRNEYKGRTAIIIGNGPSLREIPNDLLHRFLCFGTNRIYLREYYQPDFYVCINPLVIEQSADEIRYLLSDKFIRADKAHLIENAIPLKSLPLPMFSKDPARGVYEGYTVTYVCLQLAYYMGFTTVLLVGVDHRYQFDGQPNEERIANGPDPNHFHPGYFSDGVKWNNPDLKQSELAYRMARTNYEADGRKIINLTPGTALNVFEKGDYHDWL